MLFLLLTSFYLTLPPSYSAVVVDASTNKPLAAVSVRDPTSGQGTSTDERGVFTLPGAPTRLSLTCLGYASLTASVPVGKGTASADTLRLLPEAYALSEVAVRPPRAQTFSTGLHEGPKLGSRLYPGQAAGLLVMRPTSVPADQPCVITHVRLFLRDKPQQGRLRVRLVSIEPGPPAHPGANDLLPTPVVFSTQQLANAPHGQLVLDLSAYDLLLPAAGLCVVVECLPTDPDELGVTVRADQAKRKVFVTTLPRPGVAARVYDVKDFPMLEATRGAGTQTWTRAPGRPTWTTHTSFFYSVRTEVSVLSY